MFQKIKLNEKFFMKKTLFYYLHLLLKTLCKKRHSLKKNILVKKIYN